jgi:hypothetical protein
MSFSLNDIRFADLISVSSGRIDSELVFSIIYEGNAQRDNSPNSSQIDENPIPYQENHFHKKNNYTYQKEFNQERQEYLMLENSPLERRSANKYKGIH